MGADFAPSDADLFYVDIDVESYETGNNLAPYYEISTTEEFGDSVLRESPSNCEIEHFPPEDGEEGPVGDSSQTKICIIDVPEYDFLVNDLHIVYNFPPGMCVYASHALPWHFNHETAIGPIVTECESGGEGGGNGFVTVWFAPIIPKQILIAIKMKIIYVHSVAVLAV